MVGVRRPQGAAGADAGQDLEVLWHDVECGGYGADLELWRELAAECGGPVLELGCGTGRVALDLAARGHEVTGLDSDAALVGALAARARDLGRRVHAEVADARSFDLGRTFSLVLAPMQVLQLLGGPAGRRAALGAVRRHLRPGGLFAPALADPFEGLPDGEALPPLPDMHERDGWVYSSTPVAVREEAPAGAAEGARVAVSAIDRLRQGVSPTGELSESLATVRLERVAPEELERDAEPLGYRALERRWVPETDAYVGSVVVMLEAIP